LGFFIGENKMGRPLKIAKGQFIDIAIPSQELIGNIGVVGGENPTGPTLLVQANIEYAPAQYAEGDSIIVRQKGEYKFLVANVAAPEVQGICYVVNITGTAVGALKGGQMAIIGTDASAANVTIAKIQNAYCVAFADQTASAANKANITLGDAYYPSFVAANAAPQPGSEGGQQGGPDGGGAPGGGRFPIILLPSI
jgi:hypothetical protein